MSLQKLVVLLLICLGSSVATPIQQRVVNGTDASINDYPFMASGTGGHSCGASLISPEWVLCAAHCIGRLTGYHSIQHSLTNISTNGSNIVPVKYSIIHENYDDFLLVNDISLLRLEYPVNVSRYAQLPAQFEGTSGDASATLIGWGLNATGGTVQTTLQRVELQTFSNEQCQRLHRRPIWKSNICAGVPEGGKGQCSGDSGGPLLVNGVQVGAVSWSEKPCTIAPYPGVYTQISYFREWIRQKSGI